MSVMIRGMEMPKCCDVCQFSDWSNLHQTAQCKVYDYEPCFEDFSQEYTRKRSNNCPLVELPEKHGDLIDRTTLLKEFELAQKSADMHGREFANAFYSSGNEISTEWWAVEELVENAIAVIEAEGE